MTWWAVTEITDGKGSWDNHAGVVEEPA